MKHSVAPLVLGIASSHNGGACLLCGDEIVVAIQEERLLRQKRADHPGACASLSVQYCLDYSGVDPTDLDLVVLCAARDNRRELDDVTLNSQLRVVANRVPTCTITHHLGHAFGAFATSGFHEAAVLVADGSGSPYCNLDPAEVAIVSQTQLDRYSNRNPAEVRETITMYAARGTEIRPLWKQMGAEVDRPRAGMPWFWSLGAMYEAVGWQIFEGSGSNFDDAGKVMGLAALGQPLTPVEDFLQTTPGEILFKDTVPLRYRKRETWPAKPRENANLAASVQRALEEALLYLVRRLRALSNSDRLCYAGGVALNGLANERILTEGGFRDVFIMPAAEDSGTAIGAAYYGLWKLTRRNALKRTVHDAMGREYRNDEIASAIKQTPAVRSVQAACWIATAVELLCDGQILGWFQGRSEMGPRALGQRSILCDPRSQEMQEHLNRRVKFREPFRPFAPAVLLEQADDWFHTSGRPESPFMLRVVRFLEDKKALVPAVVHADGTGRLQTLTAQANETLYLLVRSFFERTGVPLLLNTSFNIAGEPIVETPEDALWCMLLTGIDCCVLEKSIVTKDPNLQSVLDLYVSLTSHRVMVNHPTSELALRASAEKPFRPVRVWSFHRDRHAEIEAAVLAFPNVLQVFVDTSWGPVVNLIPPAAMLLLSRIDGKSTGWDLLAHLRRETSQPCSESTLVRSLASLRRGRVLNLHEKPAHHTVAPPESELKE